MDDFYDAVNHDTLNGWEIPAEQADMSWFRKAREDNYSKVNDLIRQASSEAGQAEQEAGSDLYNIRALNLTGLDRETRDREGYGRTAGAFLKEVDSAGSVSELLKACLQFQRDTGLFSLMGWYYEGTAGIPPLKSSISHSRIPVSGGKSGSPKMHPTRSGGGIQKIPHKASRK